MEGLIRSIIKFGGTLNEDVVKWLHDMEEIFDRVQLRPSNKFIVAQFYLTKTAAMWFRFNKSNIPDWSTFQIEIVKAFQLSAASKISLISTIPQQEKENENNRIDLIHDNQIKSFEALENKCLRKSEQGFDSPMLVNINDLDLKVQAQCSDVADDYDKLEQQGASINKSGSVEPDVEDVFETIVESMGSLPVDDSLTYTVTPPKVQYLLSDNPRPCKRCIFKTVHTASNWNLSHGPPYEDSASQSISKKWNYLCQDPFRYHFHNRIYELGLHFRKWKYR
ncbi:unnamed protein product [Rotaria socialis]|uniref:Uncharacterized protein n=1 Tax=Rotaria socialis TaxID=392032 RepID=A0A821CAS0_9BILA|nr:unnamed protein product [Rotaria socialis]